MGTGPNAENILGKQIAVLNADFSGKLATFDYPLDELFPNLPANIETILQTQSIEIVLTTVTVEKLFAFWIQTVSELELIRADPYQFFTIDRNALWYFVTFKFIVNNLKDFTFGFDTAPAPIVKGSFTIVPKTPSNIVYPKEAIIRRNLGTIAGSVFWDDLSLQNTVKVKELVSRLAVWNGDLNWLVEHGAIIEPNGNGIKLQNQNCFAIGSTTLVPFQTIIEPKGINTITRLTNLNPTPTASVVLSHQVKFEDIQ